MPISVAAETTRYSTSTSTPTKNGIQSFAIALSPQNIASLGAASADAVGESPNALFSLFPNSLSPLGTLRVGASLSFGQTTDSGQAYSQNGSRGAGSFKVPRPNLGEGFRERAKVATNISPTVSSLISAPPNLRHLSQTAESHSPFHNSLNRQGNLQVTTLNSQTPSKTI